MGKTAKTVQLKTMGGSLRARKHSFMFDVIRPWADTIIIAVTRSVERNIIQRSTLVCDI